MTISSDRHPSLSGYELIETLYQGSKTEVYRAIRLVDEQAVVIKLLRQEYPTFSELLQFRNQYTIAKNLQIPGIVRPLCLETYRHSYALVMEDFGGISLREYTKTHSLKLAEFLEIALQLADILHYLYQNRVIHKDIKPANILIHPETQQVKLIDFSISSLLPKETQDIKNPQVLEGTLAYLSPEQTGRMNRGIDYRSDFYSLGVTLFELLTGQLPFLSEEPMELVHCHIAKKPPPLREIKSQNSKIKSEEIPQVLADLVMKLIAKNAEDRYQSALGLKYDLEKCLKQWQETGKIEAFEIGTRDICDRFTIPEKLYGRESEVETLLQAFERVSLGTTEMMLVAGCSGIGKTAVVNEIHKPIVRQRGYFIKGKYDQFQRNIPFSGFVQAFRELIGQLFCESDAQLQAWKSKILEAVGENGQVIIEVIPELVRIVGEQPPAPELSGTAAQNRFNLLFHKFIQVFMRPEHPLVMFLDDLQWADSASLNLLQLLMQDTEYLLVLGAYRNNEVSPAHPFILTVDEIVKTGAAVNTMTLQPLSRVDLNQLVADTLNCKLSLAQPLTELVYQKTQGNPFFATQFLKALYEDGEITFDWEARYWECDITQVKALALTDDVVEFMALQLQKLPLRTQDILKLASCIGAQFDLHTLAIISEQSLEDAAIALWKALQEGLIVPNTEIYKFFIQSDNRSNNLSVSEATANPIYRFLHDRVQQAAYSLIPADQKQATHLKIGQLLQQNFSEIETEEKLFDIVEHLNRGKALINQHQEREALAQLNFHAGGKARSSIAYAAARIYLQTGIDLLEVDCWQSQYDLTLNLHTAAAEASYLNADFEGMGQIAAQVLQNAQTILDKVKVYEIQIVALTAQGQIFEAIAVSRDILAQLGVELPTEVDAAKIGAALQNLNQQLEDIRIEDLVDLPLMSHTTSIAAMQLLVMSFAPILQGMPGLLPLLSATIVNLSLQFGNTSASTVGYAIHGMVLCNFLGDINTGYSFGRLALSLLDKLNVREFKCIVLAQFGCMIQPQQEALMATIATLKNGYLAGMETGDFLHAGYNLCGYFDNSFCIGAKLDILESELADYGAMMIQVKQYSAQIHLDMKRQIVKNLRETVSQPDFLVGTAYNETVMLPKYQQENEFMAIAALYIYKLLLAYVFGDYKNALHYMTQAKPYLLCVGGMVLVPIFHFYAALTQLAIFPMLSEIEQAETLTQVEIDRNTLYQWAQNAPMNHLHKWHLVEAQKCRVLGNKAEAIEHYDRAIALAKENQFVNEEALANELAAKFYLDWGKEKIAQAYMTEAYYCYTRWGAKTKVVDLESHYPQLLAPILQRQPQSFNPTETMISVSSQTIQTSSFGHTSLSEALDLATILKASQSLSSEIELEKLLSTLLEVILKNAGADKCALLMPKGDRWFIEALSQLEQPTIVLRSLPSDDRQIVPVTLIDRVKNTLSLVVIENVVVEPVLASDPYMLKHSPKSVLCAPILNQGKLIGILYLENNLTVGAFTRDRLQVIQLLTTQAAISLKNAQLYCQLEAYSRTLEEKVAARTEESEQKNAQLLALFNAMEDVIIVMDAEGRYLQVAPSSAPLLYKPPTAIIGKTTHEVFPVEMADYFVSHIQQAIASKKAQKIEYSLPIGDSEIWFDASIACMGADKVVIVAREISDRKQMENELREQKENIEKTLQKLQRTQIQLIQSEKMSALGQLVAGIAHEINNPISFIHGNVNHIHQHTQDLLHLLSAYQSHYPHPPASLLAELETVEFKFLQDDLQNILKSMKTGSERIRQIVLSLRNFSRLDESEYKAVNLHEGIENTLMILQHRLKARAERPEIEIIKQYGELPLVECYPKEINQVFMNLILNAIDALEESNRDRSFSEITTKPNQIWIRTVKTEENQVQIIIADNGVGIPENVRSRLFDPFFTTKPVGKGTGLGLSLSYQAIAEKHGGSIHFNSTPDRGTEFIITLPIKAEFIS